MPTDREPIYLKYKDAREERVMKWADKYIAPIVKKQVMLAVGEGAKLYGMPLPHPLESILAFCITTKQKFAAYFTKYNREVRYGTDPNGHLPQSQLREKDNNQA